MRQRWRIHLADHSGRKHFARYGDTVTSGNRDTKPNH
jgi:hypothetical protein